MGLPSGLGRGFRHVITYNVAQRSEESRLDTPGFQYTGFARFAIHATHRGEMQEGTPGHTAVDTAVLPDQSGTSQPRQTQ
jgi:hypothetical protein